MKTEYLELEYSEKGLTYVRKDRVREIGEVDVVIFDCDGVLLDVRESYIKAVSVTTSIIIEAFTGYSINDDLFDEKLYLAYKRTGGFNNDWTHTYAYVMKTLSILPSDLIKRIDRTAGAALQFRDLAKRLDYVKQNQKRVKINEDETYKALLNFTKNLDSNGLESVDQQLLPVLGENVKKALNYRAPVGESIISTLFEEIFCGVDLYEETFKTKAQFIDHKEGFVENEKIIIKQETLEKLENIINNRLGIVSSSLENNAYYILGDIIENISKESMMWHEDVDKAIKETGKTNLHKPNPYSLLKASKPFKPYKNVLYVGDTIADMIMTNKTRKIESGFLFAGVYGFTSLPEEVMMSFLEEGCDIVTPSVNELPAILEKLKDE